jgi:hypothetical protein
VNEDDDDPRPVPNNGTCPAHPFMERAMKEIAGRVEMGFRDFRAEFALHRREQAEQIDRGFQRATEALNSRVEGVHEEILCARTELNDRITAHRTANAGDINRVHERIDDHIEQQHARSNNKIAPIIPAPKPDSEPRLPAEIDRAGKWFDFALKVGAVLTAFGVVLYYLYRAAEAGLFK